MMIHATMLTDRAVIVQETLTRLAMYLPPSTPKLFSVP